MNPSPLLPPLPPGTLRRLQRDADNVRGTAARKHLPLDRRDEARETHAARLHFALGCWLHYYHRRISASTAASFHDRVDCLRRLFQAGITHPHYDFYTVFDFGERHFDTLLEMGDADEVIDAVRHYHHLYPSDPIRNAFTEMGWPLDGAAVRQCGQLRLF